MANTTQAPTNTYKLSYSGPEVNERLGRLGDTLVKTGDTAYDLKVEGTMTNDTDAVNVAWVNRLLNQNYLSLKGTSNSAPVTGPLSTKGAIYDFPTEHRAVFTYDLLTLGGYKVYTSARVTGEATDKTKFNLVYVDNAQLEKAQLDDLTNNTGNGVNEFHPETGDQEPDTGRFDSPVNGQSKGAKYRLPKIRFSNLAFYPKHLIGEPCQNKIKGFDKDKITSPEYGYGITDVLFKDRKGQGEDSGGKPLTVSLTGKEYGLTIQLGTLPDETPITRQVAYAGNELTHYNLYGELEYKENKETTGTPAPTRAKGGYTQEQIASLFENLVTRPITFSGVKTFNSATQFNGDITVAKDKNTTLNGPLTVAGATTLNNTLTVADGKKTTLKGELEVKQAAVLDSTLAVGSTLAVTGTTTLTGKATLNGGLEVAKSQATILGGTLEAKGTTTLDSTLKVKDNTTLDKTLSVGRATTLNGGLTVTGETEPNVTLKVADGKNTVLGGTLEVKQGTTLDSTLTVKGDANLNGAQTTIGDAAADKLIVNSGTVSFKNAKVEFTRGLTVPFAAEIIPGTQNAAGSSTFTGNVTVNDGDVKVTNGALTVSSKITGNGGLDITGATALKTTLTVTGATTLNDTLTVNKKATFNAATEIKNTLTVTGNYKTTLGGALEVAGNTTLKGTLGVTGASTFTGLTTHNGGLKVAENQATILGGTLEVKGTTTLDSAVKVKGAATLDTTLNVAGATTLASTLGVTGLTTLNGGLTVATNQATSLGGTLTVTGATTLKGNTTIGDDATADTLTATVKTATFGDNITFTTSEGKIAATTFVGALTGNATSATKWATKRSFTVKDADNTNAGTATTGVDGTADVVLNLPSTIKATLSGNASSATKWATAQSFTINDSSNAHSGTATTGVDGTAAVTLHLPATITASLEGNATSATTAASATSADSAKKVANALTIDAADQTTVTYDGSAVKSISIPIFSALKHGLIKISYTETGGDTGDKHLLVFA